MLLSRFWVSLHLWVKMHQLLQHDDALRLHGVDQTLQYRILQKSMVRPFSTQSPGFAVVPCGLIILVEQGASLVVTRPADLSLQQLRHATIESSVIVSITSIITTAGGGVRISLRLSCRLSCGADSLEARQAGLAADDWTLLSCLTSQMISAHIATLPAESQVPVRKICAWLATSRTQASVDR